MHPLTKTITWLTAFSIAMGFMETAVVVYLRKIYYPAGFYFPLIPIDPDMAIVEVLREAATIIMLAGIGILTGKNSTQRFAFFIYSFAIWDIFYYVFLKIFLDWPASLFTWDILFLIPVPWVGPVLAPCLVSLTMMVLTFAIVHFQRKGYRAEIKSREKLLLGLGCTTIVISFMWDYFSYINNSTKKIWTLSSKESLFNDMVHYVPESYNWWLFGLGEAIIIYGIATYIKNVKNTEQISITHQS